jgi:hypothetical protein
VGQVDAETRISGEAYAIRTNRVQGGSADGSSSAQWRHFYLSLRSSTFWMTAHVVRSDTRTVRIV